MTISDTASLWLPDAKFTRSAGVSLATSLYRFPLTIGLSGHLGAGKTTFLQGFLAGLGVEGPVLSPTYALENRYETAYGELLHIDLYRLNEADAKKLILESEEFTGIRCVEWSDRVDLQGDISIHLAEETEKTGRSLTMTFSDISLPKAPEISRWRDEVSLPAHIRRHCDAVADLAEKLGEDLLTRGIIVRPLALRRAAEVHDLFRFIDFHPGASHEDIGEEPEQWVEIRKRYIGMRHEEACANFLRSSGYPEIAAIVAVHGLRLPPGDRATIEQKLLYYADKRVIVDKVVTLEERFEDFRRRYSSGEETEHSKIWFAEAKAVEKELFRDSTESPPQESHSAR